MRTTAWISVGIIVFAANAAAADGGTVSPYADQAAWARWQGRLSLATNSTPWRLGVERSVPQFNSASLMGDYYFGRPIGGTGWLGGFRATSGVMFGPRGVMSAAPPSLALGKAFNVASRSLGPAPMPYANEFASDNATLPYLGLGYTGLRSAWTFSADLGLLAQSSLGSARLGRVLGGGQSLDDAVRELRLAPLLQFGVSYSF